MNILQHLKVKFQCNYLYGLADMNMNLSPNPFSSHSVLCIFVKALQKGCGCTDIEIQVELAGTWHSFPLAKLILSPLPSNNWFIRENSRLIKELQHITAEQGKLESQME